ncbi:ankyrin repeat-containing protein NPR4-like [Rosa rugosa]|uniref:ankyrin repeat-containing protein NPR4-like n=1 Tax=Rosa rugosa TaxID=74645 RepID=UPI002B403D5A|nr:ankyrin repeat-containing protein NPR4-like [Rosa rugosa]
MKVGLVHEAICQAVDQGIVEFVTSICKANSELVWRSDEMKRSIFHLAIKSRQEKVFSLLYGLSRGATFTKVLPDKFNNNMLHMAAMLSPMQQLNRISGAALQMQRELQWFEEVESLLPIQARESKNYTDHMTPRELFTKNHKELMKEGEKWMKDTANSCTVLGALVITIVFAAAITVPGGNKESTGFPVFLMDKIFKIFIIADALSLVSSTTSLLVFWGIVTSRYAEEDFLKSLPTAMTIGLSTLLFSISTMIIAFCSVLLMMFSVHSWLIMPIVVPFSIPVALSIWMLIPLLTEIFSSTFGPGIFDKRVKPWF